MAILKATHTTVVTTALPPTATLPQVLSLLHDHAAMISMNPLVISHRLLRPSYAHSRASSSSSSTSTATNPYAHHLDTKPLPPPPTYEVVDSLDASVLIPDDDDSPAPPPPPADAGWAARMTAKLSPSTVTYTAQMRNVPHGLETTIHAPMGIKNLNTWSVREGEGGGLVLEERSMMSANRLVIGFVAKTAQSSHEQLVGRFVKKLRAGLGGEWDDR